MRRKTFFCGCIMVSLFIFSLNAADISLFVKSDGTGDYDNISAAIEAVPNGYEAIVYVFNTGASYTGSQNLDLNWDGNVKNIRLIGINGGDPSEPPLLQNTTLVAQCLNITNGTSNDVVQNFIMEFNECDGIIISGGCPVIKNNHIRNSGSQSFYEKRAISITNGANPLIKDNYFANNSSFGGGAIKISHNSSASINGNVFYQNYCTLYDIGSIPHGACGGAIETYGDNVVIEGNEFIENYATRSGGAMYIEGDNVLIKNNYFENNENQLFDLFDAVAGAIGIDNSGYVKIVDNIFADHENYYWSFHSVIAICYCVTCDIVNCNFVNNRAPLIGSGYFDNVFNVVNCIFIDNYSDYSACIDNCSGEISYCNTYQNCELSDIPLGNGCLLNTNPRLDTNTHRPLWNSATISPCIDAGNPDTDGDGLVWYEDSDDQDSDGTRKDIGAKTAVTHDLYYTTLPQGGYFNIKWLCFPAVNDLTQNMNQFINVVPDLLLPSEEDSPLEQIKWKPIEVVEPDMELVNWMGTYWSNIDYIVDPAQGFVFTMDGSTPTYQEVRGFNESPSREIQLYDGQENWLGYFLEEQQSYLEAIRDFEDDIYMVKGQYQSITKIDGIWMGNAYQPVRYGDMLKIFTTDDITFRWHNPSGGGGSTKETQMATNYLWTEEEDYIPVIVEFVEMDIPREIGVFAEEECVGAAVVEDSTIIICTYITDDPSVELEFDLYYGRSLHNVRMKPAVTKQPDNSYFRVSINGNLNQCPVPLSLYLTNYPNPFNPATVIEYGLVEAGKVDLSIYNIKGQLVKNLVDGQQDAGMHSVNWNGKDENNNSVASGVYFSIMKAGKEIIRNRMLLLK